MFWVDKVVVFNRFVAIFGKKYGSFSPKDYGEKKNLISHFSSNDLFILILINMYCAILCRRVLLHIFDL